MDFTYLILAVKGGRSAATCQPVGLTAILRAVPAGEAFMAAIDY
jgi:hypothetical protein